MKKKTTDEFIKDAKKVHGDKYDYSKVEYVNSQTKVCIICPKHGEFWQTPCKHLNGRGCNECGKIRQIKKRTHNTKDFIDKSKQVHIDKYDYSKVDYVNSNSKVCIVCPKHGEFWQIASVHLSGGGCCKCINEMNSFRFRTELNDFIKNSKKVHGDKYDYSKVEYVNNTTKVCIICPKHGEFWQLPSNHLSGKGCMKCYEERRGNTQRNSIHSFISNSIKIHGDKYDYSKVTYLNTKTKVCIICPEHGEFWQRPEKHLIGNGCPKCTSSHLENEVRNLLVEHRFDFEEQKKFDWLGRQILDFYLPDYNIAIECQGIQHFEPIEHFGGEESLTEAIQRDQNKRQLCEENGISLLYYANYEYKFPYEVYTNKNELIKQIVK